MEEIKTFMMIKSKLLNPSLQEMMNLFGSIRSDGLKRLKSKNFH